MRPQDYETQVIGLGPAGLGIVVAADRGHQLKSLLQKGTAFVEGREGLPNFGSGSLEGMTIASNSIGHDFISSIAPGGYFRDVYLKAQREMGARKTCAIPPGEVSKIMRHLAFRLHEIILDEMPLSKIIYGTSVRAIHQLGGEGKRQFKSVAANGREIFSKNMVLSTGAEEEKIDLGVHSDKLILSTDVLTGKALPKIRAQIKANGRAKIVIMGSSHSAFSAAHCLLRKLHDVNLAPGSIEIVRRSNVRLFYESVAEAHADHYKFDPVQDVCPKTGRVYRYSGLREDAKTLYKAIVAQQEPRVQIRNCHGNLDSASTIIQAIGYKARHIPLYDAQGNEISPLRNEQGKVEVDEHARVFDGAHAIIPGVFAIGHGHGIQPTPEIGGEPSAVNHPVDSINIFHGPIGADIVRQIAARRAKIARALHL